MRCTGGALGLANAEALFACDEEFAPFWCPRCHSVYCVDDWILWDVFDDGYPGSWLEERRGRCPYGHERRIYD